MWKTLGMFLWTVGKILGILVLVLLVLAFLVCFAAIHYRVQIRLEEKRSKGKIYWLGGMISFLFSYQGQFAGTFRICGIPVKVFPAKKVSKKKTKKRKKQKRNRQSGGERTKAATEKKEKIEKQRVYTEKQPKEMRKVSYDNEPFNGENQKNPWKRWKNIFEKCKWWIKEIQTGYGKSKQKKHSLTEGLALLTTEEAKAFVCIVKKNMIQLWRKLRPSIIKGTVIFGTSDPCTTGQILAIVSHLYVLIDGEVKIRPDFQRERLEGKILIKGKIRIITLLRVILPLLWNQDGQELQRHWKKWKEEL